MSLTQISKHSVSVFSIALALYGCGKDEEPAYSVRSNHSENTNGPLSVRLLSHAGITREYLLYIPTSYGETNWNTLKSREISKLKSDDFGFVAAIIDSISAAYRVDTSRVYATGCSNGAGMSYALACQLGDKIAAVAPVSGLMPIDGTEFPCRS